MFRLFPHLVHHFLSGLVPLMLPAAVVLLSNQRVVEGSAAQSTVLVGIIEVNLLIGQSRSVALLLTDWTLHSIQ